MAAISGGLVRSLSVSKATRSASSLRIGSAFWLCMISIIEREWKRRRPAAWNAAGASEPLYRQGAVMRIPARGARDMPIIGRNQAWKNEAWKTRLGKRGLEKLRLPDFIEVRRTPKGLQDEHPTRTRSFGRPGRSNGGLLW